MAKSQLPDAATLRKLLRYEPETGKLYWRERTPDMFEGQSRLTPEQRCKSWNRKNAGREALSVLSNGGYLIGTLLKKFISAHRVAWAIYYGAWAEDQIDHINGDKKDNRISNLRCATPSQNSKNRRLNANSTSGFKGVCFHRGTRKWEARITVDGKTRHLGLYKTAQDAHQAYCRASEVLHGDFGRPA